jgi:xylose isomerase
VRLAGILSNFGNRSDRFLTSGYGQDQSLEDQFNSAAQVPYLEGVELVGTWHLTPDTLPEVRQHLARTELEPVSAIPNLFGHARWKSGSFTAPDPAIRQEAVDETKQIIDLAKAIDCTCVCIWPGQDGYDYPFQADYGQAFEWFAEGIQACADYGPEIRIALEYKPKEPRNRSFCNTADRCLLFLNAIDRPNVGVTLDSGHALMAYESPAESVALLQHHGKKLFHVHLNDNYRLWDDDLIFGAIHPIEMLELIYWLQRTGYDGWCSFDQYPYREDPVRAVAESARWFKSLETTVETYDSGDIERAIKTGDAAEGVAVARRLLQREV